MCEPWLAVHAAREGPDEHVRHVHPFENVDREAEQFILFHASSFARPLGGFVRPTTAGATCEGRPRFGDASFGWRQTPWRASPRAFCGGGRRRRRRRSLR